MNSYTVTLACIDDTTGWGVLGEYKTIVTKAHSKNEASQIVQTDMPRGWKVLKVEGEEKPWELKSLNEYTEAQKVAAFNRVYKMCIEHLSRAEKYGYDKCMEHYIYEEVMLTCCGRDVFEHLNKLTK